MKDSQLGVDFILDLTEWCHANRIFAKEKIRELIDVVGNHLGKEKAGATRSPVEEYPDYKVLRQEKGETAKNVAEACGIKASHYSLIENRKRKSIPLKHRRALDRYFNL